MQFLRKVTQSDLNFMKSWRWIGRIYIEIKSAQQRSAYSYRYQFNRNPIGSVRD